MCRVLSCSRDSAEGQREQVSVRTQLWTRPGVEGEWSTLPRPRREDRERPPYQVERHERVLNDYRDTGEDTPFRNLYCLTSLPGSGRQFLIVSPDVFLSRTTPVFTYPLVRTSLSRFYISSLSLIVLSPLKRRMYPCSSTVVRGSPSYLSLSDATGRPLTVHTETSVTSPGCSRP